MSPDSQTVQPTAVAFALSFGVIVPPTPSLSIRAFGSVNDTTSWYLFGCVAGSGSFRPTVTAISSLNWPEIEPTSQPRNCTSPEISARGVTLGRTKVGIISPTSNGFFSTPTLTPALRAAAMPKPMSMLKLATCGIPIE